mgnify:FL=1|tara:strand:- start:3031 stop:3363 length:333 start_codon:yes stop_codon:yes gene_type:complete
MTDDETDRILLEMSSIWWTSKIPTKALEQWHNFLAERETKLCLDTIADLAVSSGRWPTINEFYIVYNQKKRHQTESAQNGGQLPGVKYLSKEENARRMGELRDTLKKVGE